ncbi:MAG TPA: acetyl-CoA carboxylase biotin carboxyl carrier protein [Acidobacteriaceae bacterium]
MNPNELNELRELVEFLKENKIGEFDLERGDLKVRLKFESAVAPAAGLDMAQLGHLLAAQGGGASAAHGAHAPAPGAGESAEESGLQEVKSPIVGTFYESGSPGAPPYVKVGDQVEVGTVLCIVEAMKLMNEIESDVAGEIVKLIAVNGQPVEFGQPLYAIKPR